MDNLTHSLAGAVLGQLGLKKKTGLGMATLIIAANIPDIDAVATLLGGEQHLAIRRGITHGPIAMLLLPIILTGFMLWFDAWQTKRGKRPDDRLPMHKGWLLGLAYIGTLSHPAMDWLNSYGVRLLEPFSSQWYYGDSIFIIDIWIWAALIAGVWISRRREKKGRSDWQRPAWLSFTAICAYIFANGLITGKAEAETTLAVEAHIGETPALVVANPVPVFFWQREMLWRGKSLESIPTEIGKGEFSLLDNTVILELEKQYSNTEKVPVKRIARDNSDFAAFLFWSRMPFFMIDETGDSPTVTFRDQRFDNPLLGDRFRVVADMPEKD